MSNAASERDLFQATGPRHVIGLDIGDGESALCWVSTDPATMRDEPKVFERDTNEKSIITAIAWEYGKNDDEGDATRLLIGEEAVMSEDCLQFSVNFKTAFDSEHQVMPRQVPFSQALLREFFHRHPEVRKDCAVYVGHPAGWPTDAVEAYAKQFGPLDVPVRLMPESQSALVHVRDRHTEDRGNTVDRDALREVLIVDVGSSTTDFTFVDDLEPRNLPVGASLGCRRIDDALAALLRAELADDKEFTDALAMPGGAQMLRLVCRRAKEAQFSSGNGGRDNFRSMPQGCATRFAPIVHKGGGRLRGVEIPRLVAAPGGWADDFRAVLAQAKRELGSSRPQLIIVTGGGSRMPVVREACAEAFPDAEVRNDPTPSFTVARGLASAGRHRVGVDRFRRDIRALKDQTDFNSEIRAALLESFGEMISLLRQRVELEAGNGGAQSSTPLDEQIREVADLDAVFRRLQARLEASLTPLVLDICRAYGIRDDRFRLDLTVPNIVSVKMTARIRGVLRTAGAAQGILTTAGGATVAGRVLMNGAVQAFRKGGAGPLLFAAGAVAAAGAVVVGSAAGIEYAARWRLQRALETASLEPTEITRLVEEVAESIAEQMDDRAREVERFVLSAG
ncbi:Hsp70 family protein [Streptomyces chartreusis]|uniref:Hsp70 family protein n=1 Tax=Streptomyces chartreusis TaxID=1969 RepID=UPI0036AC69C0